MGDRANIVIDTEGQDSIYLYTHWSGSELPATLQRALARKLRWTDEAYLTRIIFCEMVSGCEREETGYGISVSMPDNSYPFLRVDTEKQTVTVDFDPVRKYHDHPNKVYTFEE